MAQKTDAQLSTEKDVIKTETTANANTATRVGQMLEDIIDSKVNNDDNAVLTINGIAGPTVDLDATDIEVTPVGGISSTNVQTAIEELDSDIDARIAAALTGLNWKTAARVATTTAGTFATSFENGDTVDGVVLATGDRILLKDQADATTNGIYIVPVSGSPTRATDADAAGELEGAAVLVQEGTSNANTTWTQITDNITLGVSNISWTQLGTSAPSATESTAGILKLYDDVTGNNTDGAPDQNSVKTALALKSPLASPTFTGTPAAPTAAASTNTTQVATTAFVQQEITSNSIGFNPVDELTEIAGITLEGDITVTQLLTALAIPGCIPIHIDAATGVTITNMPSAATVFPLTSTYQYTKFDTTNIRRIRLYARVVTGSASANSPRMYIQYSINGGSNYTTLGAGTIASGDALSLVTAGMIQSNWITVPAEAKGGTFIWRLVTEGGDGAIDPVVGNVFIEYST